MPNFRAAWEALPEEAELVDDYGIGQRDSLGEAVEAVGRILGMAACEGSDAVPPNARSHTLLLAGTVVGDVQVRRWLGLHGTPGIAPPSCSAPSCVLSRRLPTRAPFTPPPAPPPWCPPAPCPQVLVRLAFGIDAGRNVAMKLAVRSEAPEVSEAMHAIIQEA